MEETERQRRIREETARRLDEITSTPGAVLKYDRNGDGKLDAEEWELLRELVEAEVVRELVDQAPTLEDPSSAPAPERVEWTVDVETADPHIDLPVLEVIDERYEVLREIGEGTQGRTYLGRVRASGEYVALKEMSFTNLEDWKALDLFERECRVLRELDYPSIPRFVDTFHVGVDGERPRFFLVQSFVMGDGLDVVIARGERFSEAQVVEFARQILELLAYLHDRDPPVVHRDVKPANVIRSADGTYSLVDFGGVQIAVADDVGGSTVIGTTGYMPPEQLSGRASPRSDLYALGATLVHLLTHVHPSKLPQRRMRLVWRDRANVRDELADFVDRLIAPVAEDRPESAAAALTALRRRSTASAGATPRRGSMTVSQRHAELLRTQAVDRPPGAKAEIALSGDSLSIKMKGGLSVVDVVVLVTIVAAAVFAAITPALGGSSIPTIVLLNVALFYGAAKVGKRTELIIGPDGHFSLQEGLDAGIRASLQTWWGFRDTARTGQIADLDERHDSLVLVVRHGPETECGKMLDEQTRRWVARRIRLFLRAASDV